MPGEVYHNKFFYSQRSNDTTGTHLSLLLQPHALMYAIFSKQYSRVEELCHVEIAADAFTMYDAEQTYSQLITNYRLDQMKFEKVTICFLDSNFAIVPNAFAQDLDGRSVLSFSGGKTDVMNSMKHTLKNITFYFSPDPPLFSYFERTFSNASFRHSGAVAISLFNSQHSLVQNDLYLNLADGVLEIIAKNNNDLLFYNNYSFSSDEDVLYYLLFSMEQFELSPLQVNLVISAQRTTDDDLVKDIRKYIKNVTFSVQHPSIQLAGELLKIPSHFYFTLLNQHLCEL